jgi:hypothetical protein
MGFGLLKTRRLGGVGGWIWGEESGVVRNAVIV